MSKIDSAISEIHALDKSAERSQWVNDIHPLVKLLLTLLFIFITVSFPKYELLGTAGMILYILPLFILSELSFLRCIKRIAIVLPLILVVGIANPILDRVPISLFGIHMTAGVLSMLTLMLKGIFAVLASYILIASTGIEKICYALRLLHVPRIMVTQLMLTYRYISVLMSEVSRITSAYSLRAPGQKGVHFKVWGSLTGQLLLRSIDRADTVFESMTLRGYRGDFDYVGGKVSFGFKDGVFLVFWIAVFLLLRFKPVFVYLASRG
ncbi:MAG: cobalt ECF transporter T component CbiQ [Oscillospiraceae bacterium]|nr:cobalt ECF transporter T component CbiQ [Oscillospiraceae bacterium]